MQPLCKLLSMNNKDNHDDTLRHSICDVDSPINYALLLLLSAACQPRLLRARLRTRINGKFSWTRSRVCAFARRNAHVRIPRSVTDMHTLL